jgi:uncharacterized protein
MSDLPPWESAAGEAAAQEPVAVPHEALSPAALRGLIEAFVLREGTDYGAREVAFETKVAQVAAQLQAGEVQIWFDPGSNSVDIIHTAAGR